MAEPDEVIFHLTVLDHYCLHPDQCSDAVVEPATDRTMGTVRKLVLSNESGRFSRFVPDIETAIAWAKRNGAVIPTEDIEKCKIAMAVNK